MNRYSCFVAFGFVDKLVANYQQLNSVGLIPVTALFGGLFSSILPDKYASRFQIPQMATQSTLIRVPTS